MCSATCLKYAVSHLITFQHREFLRNNFARLFGDRWNAKKLESEIIKPIGKNCTNPTISKLKLNAKTGIEEILGQSMKIAECPKCHTKVVFSI